jgi:hypothetical protein
MEAQRMAGVSTRAWAHGGRSRRGACVNLHARQWIHGNDRRALERLGRYVTRPPIAQHRLHERADGTLLLTLKSAWRDGTRAIVLEPDTLLARLRAAVPPPRFHMLRYYGVLSSHSKHRAEIVPTPPRDDADKPPPAEGEQLLLPERAQDEDEDDDESVEPRSSRKRWAFLLRWVFRADVDTCPKCGGPMRWLEVATTPDAIARALSAHGIAPRAPPPPSATALEQLTLPFGA